MFQTFPFHPLKKPSLSPLNLSLYFLAFIVKWMSEYPLLLSSVGLAERTGEDKPSTGYRIGKKTQGVFTKFGSCLSP